MAAPIVYRWDDSGAPVARGERRSLCDILYACLVTGYGSKAAAGWTREFVNATFDKAVFRNNPLTGTGMYLQVDGAISTYAYAPNIKAFESMSDIDTGLFPFKSSWTHPTPDGCALSINASTTARPWVLIADDRFFYFFCWTGVTGTSTPLDSNMSTSALFFGDIISRYASDPYCCILGSYLVGGTYGTYSFNLKQANFTTGYSYMPRAYSGVATPIIPALINGGGPGSLQNPGAEGVPYTVGNEIYITRPHLNDATAHSFRGWLPGLYYPCHPSAFSNLQQVDAGGMSFLSFRNFGYDVSNNIFISLGDWRA